ncbi:hypothetical protein ACFWJT_08295 [Streptomyces sp. NPDC127069]|uniref:hypothetical protein n=1 Tax=Streptomyces sp. NPDC127069 TaxID=3347128 RepID=UPI00364B521B
MAPQPTTGRRLLVVERAYRGSVETQFADVLYLARELNRQQDGLDILLRGLAVTFATADDDAPARTLRIGRIDLDTLPDPRASLRTLLAEGAGVWAEEADLTGLGTAPDRLLPGVRRARPDSRPDWSAYQGVHFL